MVSGSHRSTARPLIVHRPTVELLVHTFAIALCTIFPFLRALWPELQIRREIETLLNFFKALEKSAPFFTTYSEKVKIIFLFVVFAKIFLHIITTKLHYNSMVPNFKLFSHNFCMCYLSPISPDISQNI